MSMTNLALFLEERTSKFDNKGIITVTGLVPGSNVAIFPTNKFLTGEVISNCNGDTVTFPHIDVGESYSVRSRKVGYFPFEQTVTACEETTVEVVNVIDTIYDSAWKTSSVDVERNYCNP